MLEYFELALTGNIYSPAMLAMCALCLLAAVVALGAYDSRAAAAFMAMAFLFGGGCAWLLPEPVGTVGRVVTVLSVLCLIGLAVRGWYIDRVPRGRA